MRLRVTLSHGGTPLIRAAGPVVCAAGLGLLALEVLRAPENVPFTTPVFVVPFLAYLAWFTLGLRVIHQEANELVIPHGRGETRVHASEIAGVTTVRSWRPGAITIRFRTETPPGRSVTFVPPMSLLDHLGMGWMDREIVNHVRALAPQHPPEA
jgi:hypothetical protein